MDIQRTQKRIIIYVLLPALVFYVGLRLFAQYRHVDIYVSRQASMPAELAASLHVDEHKIDGTVTIESAYDSATDKMLTPAEIRRVRSAIAWSGAMPAFIDSLTILSPTCVLARRTTRRVMWEYQLVKLGDRWLIESGSRNEIARQ